jgi:hypothetical protein
MAPLCDKGRDRGEVDRRRTKPYNIVRDISTEGSGQWLGGAYSLNSRLRKSDPRGASRQHGGQSHGGPQDPEGCRKMA